MKTGWKSCESSGDQARGFGQGVGGIAADHRQPKNGRYNPSIQLAFKIARYFHMAIEEIFTYEE